jgi:DNA polymerase-1
MPQPDQLELTGTRPWLDSESIMPRSRRTLKIKYHLIQSERALYDMRETLCDTRDIAYDSETSGLNVHLGARIIGHCLAGQTGPREISTWYVPVRHILTAEPQLDPSFVAQEAIAPILQSPGRCGYHHGKFDWSQLRADGVVPTREAHDVSILATAANENEKSFALKALADKYCIAGARSEEAELTAWMRADARKLGMKFKQRAKTSGVDELDSLGEPTYLERFGYSRAPVALCGRYGCRDALYTLYLWRVKYAGVATEFDKVYQREMAVSKLLHEMEWVGLPANEELIRANHDRTGDEVRYWMGECRRVLDNSESEATDAELRTYLYETLKLECPKWTKGGQSKKKQKSVDREARELLKRMYPQHEPFLSIVGSLNDARKMHSTYAGNFLRYYSPTTGRIHPNYNQLEERDEGGVPVTGRLSSQNPNIQNIAKKPLPLRDGNAVNIREYFYVPKGYIRAYIDFSQIELCVLAWFSQDPNLLRAYQQGLDVHQITADLLRISRDVAKQVNFGNSYGMTEMGLSLRMPGYYDDPHGTRKEAKQVLAAFFRAYALIKKFRNTLASQMRRNNCTFTNPFGRPRRLPDINAKEEWRRERAMRQMMSSIISGTAADLMKESAIRCDAILKASLPGGMLVQTIHDELIFDLPLDGPWASTLAELMRAMQDWPMFSEAGPDGQLNGGVPIKVSCDLTHTTWAEKRAIALNDDGTFAFIG